MNLSALGTSNMPKSTGSYPTLSWDLVNRLTGSASLVSLGVTEQMGHAIPMRDILEQPSFRTLRDPWAITIFGRNQ